MKTRLYPFKPLNLHYLTSYLLLLLSHAFTLHYQNSFILHLLFLHRHQQLRLQLPKQILASFKLKPKLSIRRLHVFHFFVNHLTHLLQVLVLFVDVSVDIFVNRLKLVL
jgi:hypothetical protein